MRIARHAGLVLCIVGFLLTGYALYDVAGGKIYQAWRGRSLDRALDSLPPPAAPQRISYEPGSALGRLEIPRIGLSVVVLEGSDTSTLRLGVGRLRNSSLPGEPGNVVLAGHRDTFFRSLREIRQGDRISLRTAQGTFPYTVEWTSVVNANETRVLLPTSSPALTLVTCYPFYYIGSAPQRFIVRALPPGAMTTAVPAPPPSRPSPFAAPPRPAARPAVAKADVPPATPPGDTPVEPEPASPPRKSAIKRALHKIAGVFSPHRAKLQ